MPPHTRLAGLKLCTAGVPLAIILALLIAACLHRPVANPNVIVVGVTSGPNNLDPRIGTDDVSQKWRSARSPAFTCSRRPTSRF